MRIKKKILVDSIHCHNFIENGLRRDVLGYHQQHGFRLAFSFLQLFGYDPIEIQHSRLSKALLSDYSILFINLVSVDLAPFRVDEILAIENFLLEGGSLLLITDHSNCYFHVQKLLPLMEILGIDLFKETACDCSPFTLGSGNGWIKIEKFKDHAITQNLQRICFQTGVVF